MNTLPKICKVCGENLTSSPDGLCWKCRKKNSQNTRRDPDVLQKAIKRTQLTLTILKYRAEGLSYENIAGIVGLPVQLCYTMAKRAVEKAEV